MRLRCEKFWVIAIPLALLFFVSGCSTVVNSHSQKMAMMTEYLNGRHERALDRITLKLTPSSELSFFQKGNSVVGFGDEMMWRLEAGAMHFHNGNYEESIKQFTVAEELIAEYDERAIVSMRDMAAEGGMLLTNLNALPYRGLCRDRILLPVYKALAYLAAGNEEGFRVELFRLRENQQKVMDDYKKFFDAEKAGIEEVKSKNSEAATKAAEGDSEEKIASNNQNTEFNAGLVQVKEAAHRGYGGFLNPMAIFLSGFGYMRDDDFENAHVDFDRLYQAMPNHLMIRQYYKTVLERTGRSVPEQLKEVAVLDFPPDRDTVLVVFANGRSAAFKQIAIYFPIMTAWPMCEFYQAPYEYLKIVSGGRELRTMPIADMDGILAQEFNDRLPGMITRIVLSTALKEAGKYAATYAAGRENLLVGAGVYVGSSIYTAVVNTADTRSWEVLPKEFQVAQFAMPEDRLVTVDFDGQGRQVKALTIPENCRSAIVFVNAPGSESINYKILPMASK